MGKFIRLRKGFDINLLGKSAPKVIDPEPADTYVIKPTDFQGLYLPKALVKEGDAVKAGTGLFQDKRFDSVVYASPVSGEVVEVKRGEKRRLLEIKILADKKMEYETFKKYTVSDIASLSAQDAKDLIVKSGAWPNFVQRPFAAAEITPVRDIDHRKIGRGEAGPITRRLQESFFSIVKGNDAKHDHWLSYI